MAITLKCDCGKTLRVSDESAGKKVKCPACGERLDVASEAIQTDSSQKPAPSSNGDEMVKFPCEECGKTLRVKASLAGRKVKCPACETTSIVPGADEEEEAPEERPSRKSAGKSRSDDEEERPVRSGPGPKLWIGLGAGGGALLVIVLLLVVLLSGGNNPNAPGGPNPEGDVGLRDITAIPANSQGVVFLRPAELWKSPAVRDAVAHVGREWKTDLVRELKDRLDLTPADLESVQFAVDEQGNNGWFIITTSKPYDQARVKTGLFLQDFEFKHQGKAFHQSTTFGNTTVHFVSDKVLAVGLTEDAMKIALDLAAGKRAIGTSPLSKSLEKPRGTTPLFAGSSNGSRWLNRAMGQLKRADIPNADPPDTTAMMGNQLHTLSVNFTGNVANMEFTAIYSDEERAKAMLTDQVDRATSLTTSLSAALTRVDSATGAKALRAIEVTRTGPEVLLKLGYEFKGDELARLFLGQSLRAAPAPVLVASVDVVKESKERLGKIAGAHLQYSLLREAFLFYPRNIGDPNKPLLSWRVRILPVLGETALYKQFNLNEPYDGPTNKQLWDKMPKVFENPAAPSTRMTYYKHFVGEGSTYVAAGGPIHQAFLEKGAQNYMLLAEAATPCIWTQPDDIPFSLTDNRLHDQLRWDGNGVCNVGTANGFGTSILRSIRLDQLRNAITLHGAVSKSEEWPHP